MSAVEDAARVESLAAAICDAHEGRDCKPWADEDEVWRETYRDMARAALDHLVAAGLLRDGETRTEWGVRYPGGEVKSTGYMDGVSERFARKAMEPDLRMVPMPHLMPEAVISRPRTSYPDLVGEWTEVQP